MLAGKMGDGASIGGAAGVDTGGWNGVRILVVALCFLLSMLDGIDLLIMSFIAPRLSADWAIPPQELGLIFSASLAGMAVGCLAIAPLADRFGRRRMIMIALAVITVAMLASGQSTTAVQLIVARFFVGVGVGTVGVSMTAMAAEFAPARYSNFAVGFVQAGWPLGSVITAFVAAGTIETTPWQTMLTVIGGMSLILLVVIAVALPESLVFLERSRRAGASDRAVRLRHRMGLEPRSTVLPVDRASSARGIAGLFAQGRRNQSIILWLAVTFGYFVLYFAISWIPKLSSQAGLPMRDAILAGATYNAGAFVGTSLIGFLAVRNRLNRVTALFLGLGAIAMVVFGAVPLPVVLTLATAMVIGIFVGGGFNGFWGLAASLYPPEMRGTGIGWALGVGRIGAVLGPIVGGMLVGAGLSNAAIFLVFALPLLCSAALSLSLTIEGRGAAAAR